MFKILYNGSTIPNDKRVDFIDTRWDYCNIAIGKLGEDWNFRYDIKSDILIFDFLDEYNAIIFKLRFE
jgi:hypothetical protein